jgi:indole-3-acetate monooxygenase
VFRANGFERRFRDMHAIAQQVQARNAHFEDAGRSILNNDLNAAAKKR